MTTEQLEKVQAILDKAVELQGLIRNSLPAMNVGAGHVGNELQEVIENAQDLLSAGTTP